MHPDNNVNLLDKTEVWCTVPNIHDHAEPKLETLVYAEIFF